MKLITLYLCHNYAGVKYNFHTAVNRFKNLNITFRYDIDRKEIKYPNGESIIYRTPDALFDDLKFKEVIYLGPVWRHPRFPEADKIIKHNTIQL